MDTFTRFLNHDIMSNALAAKMTIKHTQITDTAAQTMAIRPQCFDNQSSDGDEGNTGDNRGSGGKGARGFLKLRECIINHNLAYSIEGS